MNPLAHLSYLFLALAYFRKSYKFLVFSSISFITAGAIHIAPFSLIPMFALVVFLILKKQERPLRKLYLIIIPILYLIALYLPMLSLYWKNIPSIFSGSYYHLTFFDYYQNFYSSSITFLRTFFDESYKFGNVVVFTISLLLIAFTVCYFVMHPDTKRKNYCILFAFTILFGISTASLAKRILLFS